MGEREGELPFTYLFFSSLFIFSARSMGAEELLFPLVVFGVGALDETAVLLSFDRFPLLFSGCAPPGRMRGEFAILG